MEIIQQRVRRLSEKILSSPAKKPAFNIKQYVVFLLGRVRSIGFNETMEDYEQRKLGIFNQLNFFQLLTGILIPFAGLFNDKQLPADAWIVACLPAMVSVLVLYLNKLRKYEIALFAYFIFYPFVTCVVYMSGMNLGVNLFFILYGILSVFFLKDIAYMMFAICFSMVSYFILSVILKHYQYQLEDINKNLYLFNQGLAIVFIFYGLYLVKKENADYQVRVLNKNKALQEKNIQIQEQANKIEENATLLKSQTDELIELNSLKNKLFSIISHDLKAPMYALRNLFVNVHNKQMSAEELKNVMPDVVNDMNYTVGLMDNLLQWAKAQMQADAVYQQKVDIGKLIAEVTQLLRLQSEAKKIKIESNAGEGTFAYVDKDMMNLVLRNLLSNAIKFTHENGNISIDVQERLSSIKVCVRDNGTGMSSEAILKINNNDFYTTKGTASESGTGLGLMLCKEFLVRNGGKLQIESKIGEGSVFSFSLPTSA